MHHNIRLQHNISLQTKNTLRLPCQCDAYIDVNSAEELDQLARGNQLKPDNILILGGGSNLVLPEKLDRTVIKLNMSEVSFNSVEADCWRIRAEAGVVWDELVALCVDKGLRGIENLSLIPGSVGAAPIQNIGAYGVELSDVLESVELYDLKQNTFLNMDKDRCQFAYRESIFKREPGRFVILAVNLILSESAGFRLDYGLLSRLKAKDNLAVQDVRKAVIDIRRSKIPDPSEIPNAGSFFKNPYVSTDKLESLKVEFPKIVSYPAGVDRVKLAAGWLIDQAGWKGYKNDTVGVHDEQALVLVNHGHSNQSQLLTLAQTIKQSIFDTYGVELEIEPTVL